jgi:hypothetical protein
VSEPPYCCQDDEPEVVGELKSPLLAAPPNPEFQPPFEPAVGFDPE